MNAKVAIIVVIYNKDVADSNTINTLLKYDLPNSLLVIHNNGPEELVIPDFVIKHFRDLSVQLTLVNCVSNKPLSKVYNEFIFEYKDVDKYVILDDDTDVTGSFIESIYDSEVCDLQLPLIISKQNGEIYYPIEFGKVVNKTKKLDPKNTFSIGSGLIIDKNLVSIFYENDMQLFDENYALYGVDVSLFRRIWILTDKGCRFNLTSSSFLTHSLSRTEGNESSFRHRERLIDFAITVRQYYSIRYLLSFVKRFFIKVLSLKFSDAYIMLDAFINGCHPRCRTNIVKK